MATVSLQNIDKFYGRVQVLQDINVEIDDGDFAVILGPSGCGKSTLLRVIAGLEEHQRGDISIGGAVMNATPAAERGVGMLFQSYALFPHLSVSKNISFGMRMRGESKAVIKERVANAARILKLEPYLDRLPKNLSGGQRQRVAIGRSIVREPKVFLFDEPLSNLDAELRVEMRLELAKLHDSLAATMIYVTHDQIEAMTLGTK
ncbi:MAG: transporter ATP-binding protein, partial [Devosia sp.]|nr:transporter ATP-binding protein [Devosia sp.]